MSDKKIISNYFHSTIIVLNLKKTCQISQVKSEYFLLLMIYYDSKFNMFCVWTVY